MKLACVYILTNDRQTVLYTGSTNDLGKRIYFHRRHLVPGFTQKYNIHQLMFFETHPDMAAARLRERQIKGMSRAKKKSLIETVNPEWKDLYLDILSGNAPEIRGP